jgi:hypothetical protein
MNNNKNILYSHRKYILEYLYNCIIYIELHFDLIKDVYLRELGIIDIKNLDENVKNRLCRDLYTYELSRETKDNLKTLCDRMNKYLGLKREHGELPDDIKEHITSNVEFFYKIYYEKWLEKIRSMVLNPNQGSSSNVFQINDLKYVINLPSRTNFEKEDRKKMISDIENRFISRDNYFEERQEDQYITLLFGQQQQRQRQINKGLRNIGNYDSLLRRIWGGKRSINYKVQRTRHLLRRKSGTKRLRRRSRTARK